MPTETITRACRRCGVSKPLTDFHRDPGCREGRRATCKACNQLVVNQWRAAHPEVVQKSRDKWLADHPDRRKEASRAWYRKNYAANRDEILANNKRKRAENGDALRAYDRRWLAAHPEKGRANAKARRARKLAVYAEPVAFDTIFERDRGVCAICRKRVTRKQATMDHIIPLAHGGPHVEWNLQLAHQRCNSSRGAARIPGQIRLPLA